MRTHDPPTPPRRPPSIPVSRSPRSPQPTPHAPTNGRLPSSSVLLLWRHPGRTPTFPRCAYPRGPASTRLGCRFDVVPGILGARVHPRRGGKMIGRIARLSCVSAVFVAALALPSVASAQGAPPPDAQFDKVVLDQTPGEPMDIAVLPDGRVLHVTRQGHVWLHDPDTGPEVARSRARRVRARRGGTAEHRARSELRAERVDLSVLLATQRHAGRRSGHADRQRGRCAVLRDGGRL